MPDLALSLCTHASWSRGPALVFIKGMELRVFLVASSTIF